MQTQEMANQRPDNSAMRHSKDGLFGTGRENFGGPAYSRQEIRNAFAARKGECGIEVGPSVDCSGIGLLNLIKGHPFPAAEIDLPQVGIQIRLNSGNRVHGIDATPERTAKAAFRSIGLHEPGDGGCLKVSGM